MVRINSKAKKTCLNKQLQKILGSGIGLFFVNFISYEKTRLKFYSIWINLIGEYIFSGERNPKQHSHVRKVFPLIFVSSVVPLVFQQKASRRSQKFFQWKSEVWII